jgi:hypothetical protein
LREYSVFTEVSHAGNVSGLLFLDAGKRGAFGLRLHGADGLAVHEERVIGLPGLEGEFANSDAASGGKIDLTFRLHNAARRHEHGVDFCRVFSSGSIWTAQVDRAQSSLIRDRVSIAPRAGPVSEGTIQIIAALIYRDGGSLSILMGGRMSDVAGVEMRLALRLALWRSRRTAGYVEHDIPHAFRGRAAPRSIHHF